MSQAEQDHQGSIPVKKIHQAYQHALQARREYVNVRPAGDAARSAARHDLHTAVGDYYETLRSVVQSSGQGTDFWEGSERHHLWANEFAVVQTDSGDVPLSQVPDEEIDEEMLQAVSTRVEYVGLEALEDEWARVERESRSYSDATGSHSSTVERADPLPTDTLFAAARLLDELATELGFLAEPGTTTETDPTPI